MITEFIAHLAANVTPAVHYAWTSDPVEETHEDLPAIYVAPGDYQAEESGADNTVRQRVTQTVICMLGCPIDEYETHIAELRAAALGWTFQHYDALELSGGETLGIVGGIIWIQETYTTRYLITEA